MRDDHKIVPGVRIGCFRLGEPAKPQLALLGADVTVEKRSTLKLVKSATLSLFIQNNVVTQIGIHDGHPARTHGGLRLGMSLGEVPGKIRVDTADRVLLIKGLPGLCFETVQGLGHVPDEEWEGWEPITLSRTDTIGWIGVYPKSQAPPEPAEAVLE